MTATTDERDPLDEIAEDFLQRRRTGAVPSITEYVSRLPERADEVRDLLSALVMVEDLKPDADATPGHHPDEAGSTSVGTPDHIGEFRIIREIGRGGMGVVYEAEQQSLSRRVALKVLYPRAAHSANQVRRFLREARLAARLHHSNIVQVFGVGNSESLHYYSMQLINGLGLDKVMEDLRRLEPKSMSGISAALPRNSTSGSSPTDVALSLVDFDARGVSASEGPPVSVPRSSAQEFQGASRRHYILSIARIGTQAADALEYAHKLGTLHRDIKPSNLLLDTHGNAWVTDFGLAKALEEENLTESRDLVGTLRYMSPERFRGECDARSDVYALGLTLYEMVALRPAFDARDRPGLVYQITHVDPPPLHKHNPGIPRDFETIITKAIEKSPEDRYQSASAMAGDLRRFLDDRPIEARSVGNSERLVRWARRNPGVAALACTVLLLLATLAVGASIAAIQLDAKHRDVVRNLGQALRAQDTAQRELWQSNLDHARSVRRSGTIGQRFDGLEAIRQATKLGVNGDRIVELRNEAVACLALADLRPAWTRQLADEVADAPSAIDSTFTRFAFPDANYGLHVQTIGSSDAPVSLPSIGLRMTALRFSGDGRLLCAAYDVADKPQFIVWDLETGQARLRIARGVQGGAFDIDSSGKRLAIGHRDGSVHVHDLETGAVVQQIAVAVVPYSVRYNRQGRRLAIGSATEELAVQVVDLANPAAPPLRHAIEGGVYTAEWHPDGERLCAAGEGNRIQLLRAAETIRPIRTLTGHYGPVVTLAIHPRGEILASGSWDGTLRLWDLRTGRQLLHGPLPDAAPLSFNREGTLLGPGRDGAEVWAWHVADGRECRLLVAQPEDRVKSWSVDFFPHGELIASSGYNGVRFDSPGTGEPLAFAHIEWNAAAVFEPDGRHLLTSGRNGLERWPIRASPTEGGLSVRIGPPQPFSLPAGQPSNRLCISPDGLRLAVVIDLEQGRFIVIDMRTGLPGTTFGGHPGAERLAFSPDGKYLATGTWHGSLVKIWDARDGHLVETIDEPGSCDVVFSPTGGGLLTGGSDRYRLWDIPAAKPRFVFPRKHAGGQPGKGAFSADGSTIAISPTRSLVQLVDAKSGQPFVVLEPPDPRGIASMGFNRDASLLVVTFNDETMMLWDLRALRRSLGELGLEWGLNRAAAPESEREAATFVHTVEIEPHPADALVAQAEQFVADGDLAAAAGRYADVVAAGRFTPATSQNWALLALATGDRTTYRAICRRVLDHFGPDVSPETSNSLAWTCALAPEGLDDYEPAIQRAMASVTASPASHRVNTLGAVLYRAGRYDEAYARLNQAIERHGSGGTADDWVFLAMLEHRRGNQADARTWLKKIDDALASNDAQLRTLGRAPWRQRLGLKLLHAEAHQLIDSGPASKPPAASCEPKP